MSERILELLSQKLTSGEIDKETYDKVLETLKKQGKGNLVLGAAKWHKKRYGENENYHTFVNSAKFHGEWFLVEEELEKAGSDLEKILQTASETEQKDYFELAKTLDSPEDADLYAAYVLNIPEVKEKIKEEIGTYDTIYRVARKLLKKDKKKEVSRFKQDKNDDGGIVIDDFYKHLIEQLPEDHFKQLEIDEDKISKEKKAEYEDKKRLYIILEEKAKRDCFKLFKSGKNLEKDLRTLEDFVTKQTNSNIKFIYDRQLKNFIDYVQFQEELLERGDINPEFTHPATGEKGVLPSFHQTVALYENLRQKRFGIFDDCGTGKTAIAALLKPVLKENKKVRTGRTLIIGPKASSKAWSDGLEGDSQKRYFAKKQKVAWINGNKNEAFLKEIEQADFIFANYEQLPLEFNLAEGKKPVYQVLAELGYDHLIVDEVQEAKNDQTLTKRGAVTESLAVRLLANKPSLEYVTLLSGTPMPDNLNDYANILFMLKPEYFVTEENGTKKVEFENVKKRFNEIYDGNPRALYTLVKQNTIRRTSQEVSDLPGYERIEAEVELTPIQRRIIDYVFESNQKDWLTQIRYATLDPRLVSPTILSQLDLLGKVTKADSAKYQELEKILSSSLKEGEKVVIFSSMFAEGVTRETKRLKEEYEELGLLKEYEELGVSTLKEDLEKDLSKKLKREIKFVAIDAFTEDTEREQAVDNLSEDLEGIICTTKSGGVSLNYSSATVGIFIDEHYSPATTDQAIARIVRRGQKGKAKIYLLYGKDSIDYDVKNLLAEKRENVRMALDGVEQTEKEKAILRGGQDIERLKDLFLKRRGGMSIDLSLNKINNLDSFERKSVRRRTKRDDSDKVVIGDRYEPTIAQEIRKKIADDPVNCWHDAAFVKTYVDHFENLSPYLLARAKVIDLVQMSKKGETTFPEILLADAAGQGILYVAFEDLSSLIKNEGLKKPLVVERDFSKHMHKASPNPNKHLADITKPHTGEFERYGKFDFVDCSSITLFPTSEKIKEYVVNTRPLIKPNKYLQLGVGSFMFSDEFYKGMNKAGFSPLVRNVRYAPTKGLLKHLKETYGDHYTQAYSNKLNNTTFSLFEKTVEPGTVEGSYFKLENPNYSEPDKKGISEKNSNYNSVPVDLATEQKKNGKIYTGNTPLTIDGKTGLVTEVKKK